MPKVEAEGTQGRLDSVGLGLSICLSVQHLYMEECNESHVLDRFAALGGARRTSGASSRERSGGRKDWERQDRDSEGRETSEHREVIWGSGINASASSLDGFPSIDRLLYGLGLPSSPRKCWGLSCMILKTYSPTCANSCAVLVGI